MRIGRQTKGGWDAISDGDHRPPFGEARSQVTVFSQTTPQAVESFSDGFTWKTRRLDGALIHLNPRDNAPLCQQGGEGRAILSLLTKSFVIENDAADKGLNARRREQELAIGAAVLLCRGDIDTIKPSLNGPRTFIGRQNAFAFRNQVMSSRYKGLLIHGTPPGKWHHDLVAEDKGILAADESSGTIKRRLDSI